MDRKILLFTLRKPIALIEKYRLYLFYRQILNDGRLVFDVGANVGDKTAIFRKLGCAVVAVEPETKCLKRLRERYGQDKFVTIVAGGLSSRHGKKTLFVRTKYNGFSSFIDQWMENTKYRYTGDKKEVVTIYTLEELIKIYGVPDFCKIDVEGYEVKVLSGLKTKIPCLSFEINTAYLDNAKRCLQKLQSLGYHRYNFTGPESGPKLSDWVKANKLLHILQEEVRQGYPGGDVYAQ